MFKNLLSPESLARLEQTRLTVLEFYSATDEQLGAKLLECARQARDQAPYPANPWMFTYTTAYFWHLVPEVALRLNPSLELTEKERNSEDFLYQSDYELRLTVGCFLRNMACMTGTPGAELLTRESCNGNLMVLAIDRLCPGNLADKTDTLTAAIVSVARGRGTPYDGTWTPDVLGSN